MKIILKLEYGPNYQIEQLSDQRDLKWALFAMEQIIILFFLLTSAHFCAPWIDSVMLSPIYMLDCTISGGYIDLLLNSETKMH